MAVRGVQLARIAHGDAQHARVRPVELQALIVGVTVGHGASPGSRDAAILGLPRRRGPAEHRLANDFTGITRCLPGMARNDRRRCAMRIVVVGISRRGQDHAGARHRGAPGTAAHRVGRDQLAARLARSDPGTIRRNSSAASRRPSVPTPGWSTAITARRARDMVWRRATHLVWLDYTRSVIMARVISPFADPCRLAHRIMGRQSRTMEPHAAAQPSDPVGLEHLGSPPPGNRRATLRKQRYARLEVLRLRRPRDAAPAVERLIEAAVGRPRSDL